jgi:dienelactone hydrolase
VDGFLRAYWLGEAAARGYYVVSPEIRGSDLADTAGEVIPALFAWMEEELDFDPDRVALAGASNGGRGIFFAARAAPERFRALIGLPGSYAGPAGDLAGLVGKPVWLMVGEEDTSWVAAAEETAAKLEEVGRVGR